MHFSRLGRVERVDFRMGQASVANLINENRSVGGYACNFSAVLL